MSVESKLDRLSLDLRTSGLTQNTSVTKSTKTNTKDPVADSWEDDASDTDNATRSPTSEASVSLEAPGPTHLKSPNSKAIDAERELANPLDLSLENVPPPTPISPQSTTSRANWPFTQISGRDRPTNQTSQATAAPASVPTPRSNPAIISPSAPRTATPDTERKRPEKTTATANRLIAGALGIRAPPKTEEQKKYDRAVKEAEIRRKNREKEVKEMEKAEEEKAKNAVWES